MPAAAPGAAAYSKGAPGLTGNLLLFECDDLSPRINYFSHEDSAVYLYLPCENESLMAFSMSLVFLLGLSDLGALPVRKCF